MKRHRNSLRFFAALAALLLICGLTGACAQKAEAPAGILSLGEKYLSELNYEQAIVQFLKVIEIEPMNARAYTAAAEAYIGLGQTDKAIEILERGLQVLPEDTTLAQVLKALRPSPEPEPEPAVEPEPAPAPAYPLEVAELCARLYDLLRDGNTDAALEVMTTTEFAEAVDFATEESPVLYLPDGTSGKGVGIYLIGESSRSFSPSFLYYGDYAESVRSGNGIWLGVGEERSYVFEGVWGGDMPNGNGKVTVSYPASVSQRIGTLANGLWHGEVSREEVPRMEHDPFVFHFTNGIVTLIEEFMAEGTVFQGKRIENGQTVYTVGTGGPAGVDRFAHMVFREDQITLRHGIIGFAEKESTF